MQDFEENENIDNNQEQETSPEGAVESAPDFEQPQDEANQQVDSSSEQPFEEQESINSEAESDWQDAPEENTSSEPIFEEIASEEENLSAPKQSQERSYYTPVAESTPRNSLGSDNLNVSTVSKEDTVLGEVLDKKYDEMVTVQPVRFASFDQDEQVVGPPRKNLDILQDVGMKLTVELGRTRMKVRELLDIAKGSIIEIDKMAGDQAELFVCGKPVARGEVIVIEDKFGLRIASIVEQKED